MDLPKFCYLVAEEDEEQLRDLLFDADMVELINEDEIPRTKRGRLLLGGLFTVTHKNDYDRLIFDRRPQNAQEKRLRWIRLPLGAQMARLILRRHQGIRGSGDDLRTFYYRLRNAPGSSCRNCFGRAITGQTAAKFGGDPSQRYRMGLRVIGMGDGNAVDVTHTTHIALLQRFGAMSQDTALEYGQVFPSGDLWEATYIDDHSVILRCAKQELRSATGPDRDLIDRSHAAYAAADLPRAEEKAYGFGKTDLPEEERHGDEDFTLLGTTVENEPGLAGAPVIKRGELMSLVFQLIRMKKTEKSLLRRALSNFVHPFLHRRVLMSVFHVSFKWMNQLTEGEWVPWSQEVRDELLAAALLLPVAVARSVGGEPAGVVHRRDTRSGRRH